MYLTLIFTISPFGKLSKITGRIHSNILRGGDIGGTDGIDLICRDNCYLHHFEVTNRDECVSVKSVSNNVLIEEAYCNHSGGMSIGSLTADITSESDAAAVSNITMRNIYSHECTQMLMIKTYPGGSGAEGFVKDSLFENFWGYSTTYALDIDQYWQQKTSPDTGAVALSGLTFRNWTGSLANGLQRGAVVIRGSGIVPLQDITLEDFSMWTLYGSKVVNQCKNVYGTGMCIQAATGTATYTTSVTETASPAGWTAPASPAWGNSGYGTTDPIPIYTPAVFWPTASNSAAAAVATSTPSVSSASVAALNVKVSSTAAATSKSSSVAAVSSKLASSATTPTSSVRTDASVPASSSATLAVSSKSSSQAAGGDASSVTASASAMLTSGVATTSQAAHKSSSIPVITSVVAASSGVSACAAPVLVTVYV